jgi:DNA-binding Lrp family transcriptional regulator
VTRERERRRKPMRAIFVMLKVEPGTLAEVADRVTELDSFSEAYSISGAYDLLVKLYVENFDDLSRLVTEQIQRIPHVRETFTILTFHAFK